MELAVAIRAVALCTLDVASQPGGDTLLLCLLRPGAPEFHAIGGRLFFGLYTCPGFASLSQVDDLRHLSQRTRLSCHGRWLQSARPLGAVPCATEDTKHHKGCDQIPC